MNRNITAIILIAIAVGIYFTYTQGQIDTDKAILAINDQYKSAITNAQSLKTIRDSVQKDYNKISLEDRARLDKMIPSSVNNIHLIVDISRLANKNGFAVRNIKADMVQSNTPAGQQNSVVTGTSSQALLPNMSLANVRLSFDATVSYDKFLTFMQDLEKSLRIMDVTKLTVRATDTGIYDFSVEVNTYWLKQ